MVPLDCLHLAPLDLLCCSSSQIQLGAPGRPSKKSRCKEWLELADAIYSLYRFQLYHHGYSAPAPGDTFENAWNEVVAVAVVKWLFQQPDFNLTVSDEAGEWDNAVKLVEYGACSSFLKSFLMNAFSLVSLVAKPKSCTISIMEEPLPTCYAHALYWTSARLNLHTMPLL